MKNLLNERTAAPTEANRSPATGYGRLVGELLDRHGRTYSEEAGIRLADKPSPLYQLQVLSTLLSARISADIAVAAARELFAAGYRTPAGSGSCSPVSRESAPSGPAFSCVRCRRLGGGIAGLALGHPDTGAAGLVLGGGCLLAGVPGLRRRWQAGSFLRPSRSRWSGPVTGYRMNPSEPDRYGRKINSIIRGSLVVTRLPV